MKLVVMKDKAGFWRKMFKVIPEHNIVVGESRQTSLFDELANVCTRAELDCIPGSIVLDGEGVNHAKTKCDPRDKWDDKTGLDVCSAKLDLKEHLRKAKKLDRLLVVMNAAMRKMEDSCQKHKSKAKAIRKDLEDYYGGIYE